MSGAARQCTGDETASRRNPRQRLLLASRRSPRGSLARCTSALSGYGLLAGSRASAHSRRRGDRPGRCAANRRGATRGHAGPHENGYAYGHPDRYRRAGGGTAARIPRRPGYGRACGVELHDRQEITVPNGHAGVAPWRDGGGQRIFSPWVYGTIYQIDKSGAIRPYIGISHTVNEDNTVWTVKLRQDAVFQDGTPITAADIKAYWEHGAKPENVVAWDGASLILGDIVGWEELRDGDVTEAEGLRVVDDDTLEIELVIPNAVWPLYMAAWHTGISKLEQVLSDEEWFTRPVGAGPYRWTTDPDTKQFVAEADVAEFWGPSPNIKMLRGLNISDNQVKVIMFENGELDLMTIDSATYEAALDPSHPFNPLLKVAPYGGLWFIKNKIDMAPLEDLLVRKALAHGADMRSIVRAVWGPTEEFATGIISPLIPCHNPYAPGHIYDPELARQELSTSSYGNADNLPPLLIDLARPLMVDMGVAVKEYWKDNLNFDLDILKRESGMPRREASQFYRISLGSWIPDPVQIVSNLMGRGSWRWGYSVMDALVDHARSLAPEPSGALRGVPGGRRGVHGQGVLHADPLGWRCEMGRAALGRRLRELHQPRHQHAALDVRPRALAVPTRHPA